jgi:hypothetical protein
MKNPATRTRRSGTVRCAIYTRKSSEEGLEQEFNSLQAQREACEGFITSQLARNGKQANVVTAAIVRELAGFIWAIARRVPRRR